MKVYISSTFEDLKEYREKVYRQLRKMRDDVISMEDYVAGDQRSLAQCLADVAIAHIYIGIIAWRYGYVPRHDNPDKRQESHFHASSIGGTKTQSLLPKLTGPFFARKRTSWHSYGRPQKKTGRRQRG
jgi:hypothetical protein